jgi:hypothetical protein
VLCPSVVHMRGQVVDPQTLNSYDVDASLIAAGAADVQDDCRLVTLEVNAEPS